MSELVNFPITNQLDSPTHDGEPDENRQFNCVPSCIRSGIAFLTGNKEVEPDDLKDAVYGDGWANQGTSAAAYVTLCANRYGVKLYPVSGPNPSLVTRAHQEIAAGHPVIFTEPDPYSSVAGWTHVCCFFGEITGGLKFMDPYGGKILSKNDSELANILQFNQIWIMEKGVHAMTVTNGGVPAGWKDDGKTLTGPDGTPVIDGFRLHILSHTWDSNDVPQVREYGTDSLEMSNTNLGKGTQQIFFYSVLGWTPKTGVIREAAGKELLATRQAVAKYYNLYKSLQAKASAPAAPDPQLATLQQENDRLNAEITKLKTAVEQVTLILG